MFDAPKQLPLFPELPPAFWENERRRLMAVILPTLEAISRMGVDAGDLKLRRVGLIFDMGLVHVDAVRWAREYTDALLATLGTTSKNVVGGILSNWIETPGATMGDLKDRLTPHFGGNVRRADLVAVTEVTRAFAQGEALAYEKAGIAKAVFIPPGHPGCRCWTNLQKIKGVWQVIWQTNRDDLVCTRKIVTPWGEVEGCRALQGVVLSAGEWTGQKAYGIK